MFFTGISVDMKLATLHVVATLPSNALTLTLLLELVFVQSLKSNRLLYEKLMQIGVLLGLCPKGCPVIVKFVGVYLVQIILE
jgi:hypothetical protein